MTDRRLSPDKLSEITLAVTRYLMQLAGEWDQDEPTQPGGWDCIHVELVCVVPTTVRP